MAIIALIATIPGGIGFSWFRAQQLKGAADSVIEVAGKARGMISRERFRQRSDQSVLAGVDTPGRAVATLLYSLTALRRPVTLTDEDKIDTMLETVCRMTKQDREDAMAFAAWASGQVADTAEIVRRFLPIWTHALKPPERQELIDMAMKVASPAVEPTDVPTADIWWLRDGLLPR